MKTKDKTPFKQINYKKFIEENFMILDRETQIPVPFEFNVVQDKYYEMLKEDQDGKLDGIRDIILKARQQGMSSFILALFAVDFLMRPYSTSICISHRQDSTDFLFKKVKFYLDCYLEKLAVKTNQDIDLLKKKFFKSNSKNLIENNLNGSSFYILTAGAKVGGRGNSARNLLFSEAAFYQDTELVTAEEMIMASAQMVPQGKGMIFVESTANGEGNFYHKTWMKAIAGESSYRDIFFGWQEFYDEEWIEEKKKSFTSEKMFMQEYPQCVVGKTLVSDNSTSEAVKTMPIKENPLKIDNGPQEVVRIETERGYNLECTPYHRFYTGNEYKRLYELQEGDEIALLPASFNQEKQVVSYNAKIPLLKKEVEISDDLARFIGFYMGDGSYYRATVSCVFDKKDKNSIIEMRRLYDKFFGQASERSVGKNKGGVELRLSRTDFQGIFQSLDLIKPYENKKNGFIRKVHVPDYIFKSPKSVIRNFLQGLFDADGFAGYKTPRIVLFNKHLDFLYDIQRLLLMFEVSSSVKTRKAKTGDYNYIAKEIVLTATESQMFAKNIGFISQRKRERTSEWVNKKLGKNAKPLAVSDKIKSIRPLLVKKNVFNLTTKQKYYSANGLWTHNSWQEAFISTGTPFFDMMAVRVMQEQEKKPILMGRMSTGGYIEEVEDEDEAMVKVYREITPDEQLVVFADPADGQDYCAAVACSKRHYDVPIVFHAKMESSQFGYDLYYLCDWIYKKTNIWPKLAVERNTGQATIYVLKQLNYPDLFRMVDFTAQESGTYEKGAIGWTTTGYISGGQLKGTRRKMLDDFAMAVRQRMVTIYDKNIFTELKAFKIIRGKAQASRNHHDDLIIACYSDDTEALTANGWKKIIDILPGERIPSLNPKTGEVELATNLKTINEKYNGEMISFKSRGVDLLVTPDHKMAVRKSLGANNYSNLELVEAETLVNKHFKLKKDATWIGSQQKEWVVPANSNFIKEINSKILLVKKMKEKGNSVSQIHKQTRIPERSIYRYLKQTPMIQDPIVFDTDDFLSFLGFYIAEGSGGGNTANGWKLNFAQKEFSKGFKPFKELLEKMSIKYSYDGSQFFIHNTQLAKYVKFLVPGKCFKKRIPRKILELDKKHLMFLYKFMMLGDGSKDKIYTTTSVGLRDDFIEMINKIGWSAGYQTIDKIGQPIGCNPKYTVKRLIYVISINRVQLSPRFNYHRKDQVSLVNYSGRKVCLSLDKNHIFLVRRNTKTVWSGNCAGAWQVQDLTPDYNFGWNEDKLTRDARRERWRFK